MPRPNIVLITPHDLGTHLPCYGTDPRIPSPHLDQLAAEGIRFDAHFCTSPYCSPSRGSIMTGKYPHVNGLMSLVNLGWDMPKHNQVLPELLKSAGYETGLFGLQHIAEDPARYPYDLITDRSNMRCEFVAGEFANYMADRPKETGRPFYAEIGFAEVHRNFSGFKELPVRAEDITPPPYLEDTPGLRMDLAMFYSAIARMDAAVGKILGALEAAGEAANTLVVFTTDHGIAFPRAKSTLYDPGLHVSLIVRWPGVIAPGRSTRALTSHVDLFPTLAEAAETTPAQEIQGRSLMPLLRGETDSFRDAVFGEKNTHPTDLKRCIRTERWKYIRNYSEGPLLQLPTDIEVTATRRDMGDAHLAPRPETELYDLQADPLEMKNLAGQDTHAQTEMDLAGHLERFLEETHDPIRIDGAVPRSRNEAAARGRVFNDEAMAARWEREKALQEAYRRTAGAQAKGPSQGKAGPAP